MKISALAELTAKELVVGYAGRRWSPVDALDAVLEARARHDDRLNAFYCLDPTARDAALASHARWRGGAPLGPLDGVPVSVKVSTATEFSPLW